MTFAIYSNLNIKYEVDVHLIPTAPSILVFLVVLQLNQ